MSFLLSFIFSLVLINFAEANTYFYSGDSLQPLSIEEVRSAIGSSEMLVVGEKHDSQIHHRQQVEILNLVGQVHPGFHLGMEFFKYTDQNKINHFLAAKSTEQDFLKKIGWSGYPFAEYREQVLTPLKYGGWTYGANLPRSASREVAQKGLENISESSRALLPPNYAVGQQAYYDRFSLTMKGHVPEEAIIKYFEAQSMWDDTMAWQMLQRNQNKHFTAIIVGDFHVAYNLGLPHRLVTRKPTLKLLTLSQLNSCEELVFDTQFGAKADIVVTNENCEESQP